jgi:hypothetical protein
LLDCCTTEEEEEKRKKKFYNNLPTTFTNTEASRFCSQDVFSIRFFNASINCLIIICKVLITSLLSCILFINIINKISNSSCSFNDTYHKHTQ